MSTYNGVYEFDYLLRNQNVHMVMTSITGHLMETDFGGEAKHKTWRELDPVKLFDVPVVKFVPDVRSAVLAASECAC
jgi:DNA topoisomerase-3